MVATRRQVQVEPDIETLTKHDPDQMLRKRPTRRATAKAASNTATTAKAETKTKTAKTSRGKHNNAKGDVEEQQATNLATRGSSSRAKKTPVEPEVPPPAKNATHAPKTQSTAKVGSKRSRKAVTSAEDHESDEEPIEVKPVAASKAGSVRGRKAAALVDEALPPKEKRVAASTRAGSIRGKKLPVATEAPTLPAPQPARRTRGTAPKAAPLSPKKITQVSKPSRVTKSANEKPAIKAIQSSTAAGRRGPTRKRTVSDENADVRNVDVRENDTEEEDIIEPPAPSAKHVSIKSKADDSVVAESEASMSSRPTTPNDSLVQSFDTIEDTAEEDNDSVMEEEGDAQDHADASEDELCGPKTPMRRSSLRAQARYQSSVQRTIRKYEDQNRVETPARRYAVLGSQLGTPQTEKPYCKPSAPPVSATRAMSVGRAAGRALAFKDLHDSAADSAVAEESSDEQDISFLPDDDIIPMDTTQNEETRLRLPSFQMSAMDADEVPSMSNIRMEDDEDDYVVPADVQLYSDDPDDTVVVHDIAEESGEAGEQAADLSETEETEVMVHSHQAHTITWGDGEDADDSIVMLARHHDMENTVQASQSKILPGKIVVDFDMHLGAASSPVRTSITAVHDSPAHDNEHTVAGAEMELDRVGELPQHTSRRQIVDFNAFFDVGALAEPTLRMQIDSDITQHAREEDPSPLPEDDEAGDTEPTDSFIAVDAPDSAAYGPGAHVNEVEVATPMEIDSSELSGPTPQSKTAQRPEDAEEPQVPHYALPTIAFDARRKSLPALSHMTPSKSGVRPHTSDGASMPRMANPFTDAWWSRPAGASPVATPSKPRPSTAHATPVASKFETPAKLRHVAPTPSPPKMTPQERYPLLRPTQTYDGHANTVAAPARFATPGQKSPKRRETFHKAMSGKKAAVPIESLVSTPIPSAVTTPKERHPTFQARMNHEHQAKTVAGPVRFQAPASQSPKRRQTFHRAMGHQVMDEDCQAEISTPIPNSPRSPQNVISTAERYPKLKPREDYEQHAKTVAPPTRFLTPVKRSLKRPATVGKADTLRRTALFANTPAATHTTAKTPLGSAAMTPSQVPMTPHPAAPLSGVVALVEVFTLEGASASAPFVALLHRLGAKTTRAWNERITHVIFKDGSPTTLQRVRLNNKDVEETGKGTFIQCVNSRWVTDCEAEGTRMDEAEEQYAVDVSEIPRGGKRRRKSMEPSALLNLGGNIVRDRKSSGNRISSFGRSPLKPAEAKEEEAVLATPEASGSIGKENSGGEQSSPATPAWISAPGELVQQTAPMRRVRKLRTSEIGVGKSRRMTFWNGVPMPRLE